MLHQRSAKRHETLAGATKQSPESHVNLFAPNQSKGFISAIYKRDASLRRL